MTLEGSANIHSSVWMELTSTDEVEGILTAAALLVAEMAPTARDDWRRAFRNILEGGLEMIRVKENQLQSSCN